MKPSTRLALVGAFIDSATAVVQFPFTKHANTGHNSVSSKPRRDVNAGLFLGNMAYVVNASIGTPGQTVSLVISSSTTDTWVIDSRSEYCVPYYDYYDDSTDTSGTTSCIWGTFSSNLSSTYTSQTSSHSDDSSYYSYDFDTTYDDGTYAYGDYFNDTINLGGASVSDFTIGLVNETDRYMGVLGIGYNDTTYSNFPDRLQKHGLINSTAYSIWVDDEQASSGNLLFGAIDTTKFDGSLTRLSSYYAASHVEMAIEVAGINGTTSDSGGLTTITYDGTADSSSYSSSSYSGNDYLFTATFSPPDTLSHLPTDVATQMWDMAGAYYHSSLDMAVISCTAADVTTTNFTVQLGKGIYGPIITAAMADLVVPAEDYNLSTLYQYYVNDSDNLCLFGVQNGSANSYSSYSYSLGGSILRRTYAVFDLVNGEIAVAPVRFGATATSDIVEFAAYGASVPSSTMHCVYSDCYEMSSGGTGGSEDNGSALPAGVLSVPALIGMSLGIGIGALLVGIVGFLVWRHRLNKKEGGKKVPSVASVEAGEASPMMQPGGAAAAGGTGEDPEMTQAVVPPATVEGKGKGPEVPTSAALASVGEKPESSAAGERYVAHKTSAAPETGGIQETGDHHTDHVHNTPGQAF